MRSGGGGRNRRRKSRPRRPADVDVDTVSLDCVLPASCSNEFTPGYAARAASQVTGEQELEDMVLRLCRRMCVRACVGVCMRGKDKG